MITKKINNIDKKSNMSNEKVTSVAEKSDMSTIKVAEEIKSYAETLYALFSKKVREKEQAVLKFTNKEKELTTKDRTNLQLEYGHIQALHHKLEVLEFLLFKK